MAHHPTLKSGYHELVERLNRFPQGAPPSGLLHGILKMLFSEEEAKLVSLLPIKPFTAERAAKLWQISRRKAEDILQGLAGRGILLDIEENGRQVYVLPPPMAGFFEFSLMRLRGDLDQKVLSELLYQYLNVEEDFIKALFTGGETQLGRIFVHEPVLSNDSALHVLDFERASHIIKTASHIGIGVCYCRHKMSHLGRACNAPMEVCMTFNHAAASLIKHGIAHRVNVSECLGLLEQAHEHHLVQFGENVREGVNFICNCCGCCCEALIAARRFGLLRPVHTTNFIPELNEGDCTGCGRCVVACPVEAMTLVSANDPRNPKKKRAHLNAGICLGCGLCVAVCRTKNIFLKTRPECVITPVNSAHRLVLMAIERGKLQNFIFENQALLSHRAMAAILSVILRLPPVKQALAGRQLKSRYLEHLMVWYTKKYKAKARQEGTAPENLLTES
ncbi:MAG: 4Fe-4S dicluster domain-containing protein [Deltaproteobacteria bacterium]|nr:4Fe-4S dicluster domain-containing protein [Deltaproteobacteria bacterium]